VPDRELRDVVAGQLVQHSNQSVAHLVPVIDQRHEHVPAVTTHDDVAGPVRDRQPVRSGVGLDEAAMVLRVESREHLLDGSQAPVEPGRQLADVARGVTVRPQQTGHDALHPRRSRLHRSGDDNVAGPRREAVPAAAVEDSMPIPANRVPHLHGQTVAIAAPGEPYAPVRPSSRRPRRPATISRAPSLLTTKGSSILSQSGLVGNRPDSAEIGASRLGARP
jgi:hypothetical protein